MQVKVEAIVKMRAPTEVPELRAVLGTFNYYRKFVEHYSTIAAPLNNLLRNDVAWGWSDACREAFQMLKIKFTEAPILRRPDHKRPFELHTDWSGVGLGVVLVQRDDQGREFVIAYASRSNNRTERNYSSYQGECLAAVWGVSYFRSYLYGRHFKLLTDHEPLKWLMTNEKLTGMHARWAHILSEYDFEIEHRAGLKSGDADGLSRNPLPDESDGTDARMDHVMSEVPVSISAALALLVEFAPTEAETVHSQSGIEVVSGPSEAAQNDTPDVRSSEGTGLAGKMDSALVVHPFSGTAKDGDVVMAAPETTSASRDIWHDQETLHYLREGSYSPGLSAPEKDRVQHRSKGYYFLNELLRKRVSPAGQGVSSGLDKVVPPPEQRANLVKAIHVDVGHYGVSKTYSLLSPTYFWVNMFADVRAEVAKCTVCDRVKASFEVKDPTLKPLPIMGMFYRWGVDLCKMPFVSTDGNRYVVIMIEHFSKWIELVPIPTKESKHTAAALRGVLTQVWGACRSSD